MVGLRARPHSPLPPREHVEIVFPTREGAGVGTIAPGSRSHAHRRRALIILLTALPLVLGTLNAAFWIINEYLATEAPYAPPPDLSAVFVDSTPVVVTFPAG